MPETEVTDMNLPGRLIGTGGFTRVAGSSDSRSVVENASLNGIVMKNFTIKSWYDSETSSPEVKSFEIDDSNAISYISVFEKVGGGDLTALDLGKKYRKPEFPNTKILKSKFTDITENLRTLDDNLKVCANNSEDGSWSEKRDNDNNISGFIWTANEPVYPIIIQHEGYFHNEPWEELKELAPFWGVGIMDFKHDVELNGLLTFPFGPALETLTHSDNPNIEDEYGGFYKDFWDFYEYNGRLKTQVTEERYYTRTGRILGNTTCATMGMFIAITSTISIHTDNTGGGVTDVITDVI
jgi:hypothetical protein